MSLDELEPPSVWILSLNFIFCLEKQTVKGSFFSAYDEDLESIIVSIVYM